MIEILLEFIIYYIVIFILYYLLFIWKKTRYNKNRVPVEYSYLISLYKIDRKDINYKKFLYQSAFINTFIISFTYIIITHLVSGLIWQIFAGVVIIVLLIIICYGLLAQIYKKRG